MHGTGLIEPVRASGRVMDTGVIRVMPLRFGCLGRSRPKAHENYALMSSWPPACYGSVLGLSKVDLKLGICNNPTQPHLRHIESPRYAVSTGCAV